jgi:hypothetical protein
LLERPKRICEYCHEPLSSGRKFVHVAYLKKVSDELAGLRSERCSPPNTGKAFSQPPSGGSKAIRNLTVIAFLHFLAQRFGLKWLDGFASVAFLIFSLNIAASAILFVESLRGTKWLSTPTTPLRGAIILAVSMATAALFFRGVELLVDQMAILQAKLSPLPPAPPPPIDVNE